MTFAGLLPHRCKVLRRSGQQDRLGQFKNDRVPVGEFTCRLSSASGGERMEERSREVYVSSHKLYYPQGVDLREDDNVEIYDPRTHQTLLTDGNVTLIKHVYDAFRSHHREALVTVVRGPDGG